MQWAAVHQCLLEQTKERSNRLRLREFQPLVDVATGFGGDGAGGGEERSHQ